MMANGSAESGLPASPLPHRDGSQVREDALRSLSAKEVKHTSLSVKCLQLARASAQYSNRSHSIRKLPMESELGLGSVKERLRGSMRFARQKDPVGVDQQCKASGW